MLSKNAETLACRYSKDGSILAVYELDYNSAPYFWSMLLDSDTLTVREVLPMAPDSMPEKGGVLLHGRRKGGGHFLQRVEPDGSSDIVYKFPRAAQRIGEVPDLHTGDTLLLYRLADKSCFWLDPSMNTLPITDHERYINRMQGWDICADSGSRTVWYMVQSITREDPVRIGICDMETREPLGTRTFPFDRTAGIIPDPAHGKHMTDSNTRYALCPGALSRMD